MENHNTASFTRRWEPRSGPRCQLQETTVNVLGLERMIKQLAFQQEASVFCHSPQSNMKCAEEGSHVGGGWGGQLFVTFSIIPSQLKPQSHYFPTAYQRRVFADAAQGSLISIHGNLWQPLCPGGWLNGTASGGAGCETTPLCQTRSGI